MAVAMVPCGVPPKVTFGVADWRSEIVET